MELTDRSVTLDVAKGVALILMVAGHATLEGGAVTLWIHEFIYTFHMPFFLMVSGFLYNSKNANTPGIYVRRKFNSLWIKFILYNIAFILLNNIFFKIGLLNAHYDFFGQSYSHYSLSDITSKVLKTLYTFDDPENTCLALWYLKDLFLVAIVFNLLERIPLFNRYILVFVVLMFVGAVVSPPFETPILALNIKRLLCDFFFYGLGYYIKGVNQRTHWWIYIPFLVAVTISTFWGHIELRSPYGRLSTFRFLVVGVFGSLCYIKVIQMLLPRLCAFVRNGILLVNKNAIPIIGLHIIVFKILVFASMGGVSSYNVVPPTESNILWIVYTIAGVCVPTFLAEGTRRMFLMIKKNRE